MNNQSSVGFGRVCGCSFRTCQGRRAPGFLSSRRTWHPAQKGNTSNCGCKRLKQSDSYNEETSTKHHCLHLYVEVHWEGNAKEISVGERFSGDSRPLLGDDANLRATISRENLELQLK